MEIRVPIRDPFHVESLVAFDDHMKLLGYPKSLQQYEPTVRAYLNYGHQVFLIPDRDPGPRLSDLAVELEVAFAEGWEKEKDFKPKLKLLSDSFVALIKFLRGD